MDFNHLKDILSSVVGTVSVKSKEFAEVAVDKTKAAGRGITLEDADIEVPRRFDFRMFVPKKK